jgi:prepilin peptidase CpaA
VNATQYFYLLALAVALVAALVDARTGHIPNWLSVGPLALAPLAKALLFAGWAPFALALVGAALGALLPWLVYRAGGMGGGDVKLFAAVGALLNPLAGLHAVTYAFVACAAWAIVLLARRGRVALAFGTAARLFGARLAARPVPSSQEMTELRFGPFIFVGTLLAVLASWRGA